MHQGESGIEFSISVESDIVALWARVLKGLLIVWVLESRALSSGWAQVRECTREHKWTSHGWGPLKMRMGCERLE
eukprot:1161948-Pelagomonas_calceolata.AAC.13